jgi:hypothetical protein
MMQTCAYGNGCCIMSIVMFLVWWLVAAALLWMTWNRVIASLTKVKAVKYWQALLFIATMCALVAPRAYMMKKMACMRGHHCNQCHHCHEGESKGDCPYSNHSDHDSGSTNHK